MTTVEDDLGQRLAEYRRSVKEWLSAHVPTLADDHDPADTLAQAKTFQRELFVAGFAGITWPKEVGGQGLGVAEQQVFNEEAAAYQLPTHPFMIGMGMCGPTLNDLGTPEQRQRYLAKLLSGEEIWCQLFSEPGAGSDVASLQTSAVRNGDSWVINGQKIWTTNAQWADFGTLLARTDPDVPKHAGITMFIVDMRDPGVTVRPLRDMSGHAKFNEVFLDDVHVPANAVIGQVGQGWGAALNMLSHERLSIGAAKQPRSKGLGFPALVELARRFEGTVGTRREQLAEFYAQERALELLNDRMREETAAGIDPGSRGSISKLSTAIALRHGIEVASDIVGSAGIAWDPEDAELEALALAVNSTPASSLAGGTDEVQRTIIGERILGLPKEPQVDRGVPFRQLKVGTQTRGDA
ncbi:acyl-CoA dehydrogenase family protein [Streptomyces sp. CA-100214]